MPKQVDHEQRRREITEALWRIASTDGLEGVTIGQVATAAGMSKGLVQHYFRNRDEMLVYATRHLRARVEDRVAARVGTGPHTPLSLLRAILVALLPTDAESRTEALVANAFFLRALRDPAIADRFEKGNTLLRDAVVAQLDAARQAGELAEMALEPEAELLLAMITGLGQALLLGQLSVAAALAAVDRQLDKLR